MKRSRDTALARALAIAACACAVTLPGLAHAQPSGEDKALATALFREGRALLERNEVEEACRKFQESQHIDPSGGTLLNLAACHERMGRIASAWTEYNEALAVARRDGRSDREQFAAEHMRALEPRLSYIVVQVSANAQVEGLEIRRDGTAIRRAAWGTRMPVDPGTHVIEAVAVGHQTWRQTLAVKEEGALHRISVPPLVPESSSGDEAGSGGTPPRADEAHDAGSSDAPGPPWPVYVLGGVGAAGLGVGSYFGLRAFSKNSDADKECQSGVCTTQGDRLTEEAGDAADISTVAFAVGIAALGVGIAWWVVDEGEASTAMQLAPRVGPEHAGVQWIGRF